MRCGTVRLAVLSVCTNLAIAKIGGIALFSSKTERFFKFQAFEVGIEKAMDLARLKQIVEVKRAKVHEQKAVLGQLEQECR